eukprot:TRINITY_DN1374_c0_g1_i8.p1 TRINITY_DN1374_c0_g1~~TRINITY_DN1374_c0_g1_i8.p1  ORF type:complete len:351 (-),score=29.11 TRINITY_DN1374_c0_g1_i8:465-1517(-)
MESVGSHGSSLLFLRNHKTSQIKFKTQFRAFRDNVNCGLLGRKQTLRLQRPAARHLLCCLKCQKTERKDEYISRATLIWRAVKLPIYSVAVVPLSVGSCAAYLQTNAFNFGRYFRLLISSVLVIAWLNLSNDAYDVDTGADKDKMESVVNITGRRNGVMYAAYACLFLGSTGLLWASLQAGDIRVAALLLGAILCGYVYQSPPFRLSYYGLGEPLCFLAFGPLATSAFYFSQASKSSTGCLSLNNTLLSLSVLVGLTTTLILFCSHFHQIDGDQAVGKISPLVRLGTKKGSEIVQYAVITLYSLLCMFALLRSIPLSSAVSHVLSCIFQTHFSLICHLLNCITLCRSSPC